MTQQQHKALAKKYAELIALRAMAKAHGAPQADIAALRAAQHVPIGIPDAPRTSFAQAMPEQYRGDDAVVAYRRYYAAEKMILRGKPVTWTRRERPAWLPEVRS